ncbi:MAG: DUF1499 domain-containing protein [Casimicrobiaceae bacterium]
MRPMSFLPLFAALVGLAVVASGFGVRWGWWTYPAGFQILRWATYAGIAAAVVALVALLVPSLRREHRAGLALALVLAACAVAVPIYLLREASRLPAINDISTDTANPPAYVAILPLRADAPVPAEYAGDEAARAQRQAYPEVRPVILATEPRAAFDAVLALVGTMGWEVVASDPASGRIEATATTPWFGFKDDVVIRITPADRASRIDMRSHSRVGKSDLGANARRIRDFLGRVVS